MNILKLCALITAFGISSAQAGNYLDIRFLSENAVSGFHFYRSPSLRTDLPPRFQLSPHQETTYDFDDQSMKQDNYIIIEFTAAKNLGDPICDVEITPMAINRHVPRVQIKNFQNAENRKCEFNESGKLLRIK